MMALSGGQIFLLALFATVGVSSAELEIVEPYPATQSYPVEFNSFQITCVAYDPSGAKVPETVRFERKDNFAISKNMTADDNVYFTNRTEENGRKLFVTLHIRNITKKYDSKEGAYKCFAYSVGGPRSMPRGFTINVIAENELPRLHVSGDSTLQHGKAAKFYCNLTFRADQATTLKRVLWIKDGELLRPAAKASDKEAFSPLIIKNPAVKDVGNYTCLLEVLLRNSIGYNVSEDTSVNKILPWLEQREGEIHGKTGANMTLQCSARGYPFPNVEWKVKKQKDEMVTACVNSSTDERYTTSRDGMNLLFVTNLTVADSGKYYCCLPSNCSATIDDSRCQKLTVSVTDPEKPTIESDVGRTLASQDVLFALMAFAMLLCHF